MTRHSRQWETEYQGTGVLEKKVSSTLSFPGKVVGHNRINEKESESELVPSCATNPPHIINLTFSFLVGIRLNK